MKKTASGQLCSAMHFNLFTNRLSPGSLSPCSLPAPPISALLLGAFCTHLKGCSLALQGDASLELGARNLTWATSSTGLSEVLFFNTHLLWDPGVLAFHNAVAWVRSPGIWIQAGLLQSFYHLVLAFVLFGFLFVDWFRVFCWKLFLLIKCILSLSWVSHCCTSEYITGL